MTITCIHQAPLECRSGTSDKVYIVQVQEDTSGPVASYKALGFSGRRGATLTQQAPVYEGPNRASAIAAAEKLEKTKRTGSSRYTTMAVAAGATISGMPASAPVFGGASAAPATPAAAVAPLTSYVLMRAKEATEAQKAEMLTSPDWAEQRKYDGMRASVSLRRSSILAYNLKGTQMTLSAVAESELKKLLTQPDFSNERETILDGELMGDVFVAYDILFLRDVDMRTTPFYERFTALESLLERFPGLLAPTAWSEAEKRAMREQAEKENWEGTMGRHMDGQYIAGRTDKILKNKQWASCTCRVLTAHPTKRSVQVALLNADGIEEACGNVTIPVNADMPDADDLIEVRYLYALPGGSLYQPVFLNARDDKDEADLRSSLRSAPPEKLGGSAAAVAPDASVDPVTARAPAASAAIAAAPAAVPAVSAAATVEDEGSEPDFGPDDESTASAGVSIVVVDDDGKETPMDSSDPMVAAVEEMLGDIMGVPAASAGSSGRSPKGALAGLLAESAVPVGEFDI